MRFFPLLMTKRMKKPTKRKRKKNQSQIGFTCRDEKLTDDRNVNENAFFCCWMNRNVLCSNRNMRNARERESIGEKKIINGELFRKAITINFNYQLWLSICVSQMNERTKRFIRNHRRYCRCLFSLPRFFYYLMHRCHYYFNMKLLYLHNYLLHIGETSILIIKTLHYLLPNKISFFSVLFGDRKRFIFIKNLIFREWTEIENVDSMRYETSLSSDNQVFYFILQRNKSEHSPKTKCLHFVETSVLLVSENKRIRNELKNKNENWKYNSYWNFTYLCMCETHFG